MMRRFLTGLAIGLVTVAFAASPVFAEDSTSGSSADASASTSTSAEAAISTPVDLSAWFSAEQLALLSVEEQKTLADKLNALASDPVAFKKKVEVIREWLSERLEEQKEKMENQAQWEAKQKAKFEAKVDAQFAKLMQEKKETAERARRMQEKEERMKRMEEKRARQEAARAQRALKPKVLQGWVDSVNATEGVIYLKRQGGAYGKIVVNAKTVFAVVEDDGARAGTLADFQPGDRVFGLVRKNRANQTLVGVVLVKMQPQGRGGDDDEDAPPAPTPAPAPAPEPTPAPAPAPEPAPAPAPEPAPAPAPAPATN